MIHQELCLPLAPSFEALLPSVIAVLIHEVRNPLTVISTMGQILQSDLEKPKKEICQKIHEASLAVASLLRQTESLLPQQEQQGAKVDLVEAFNEELLRWEKVFQAKGIFYINELEKDLFTASAAPSVPAAFYLLLKALFHNCQKGFPVYFISQKLNSERIWLMGQLAESELSYKICEKKYFENSEMADGRMGVLVALHALGKVGIDLKVYRHPEKGFLICSSHLPLNSIVNFRKSGVTL